jgi:putative aminopeptidase FrvX
MPNVMRLGIALGLALVASIATAQSNAAVARAVASWIIVDAPPGSEGRPQLNRVFSGWKVDAWGNYSKTAGSGAPHRVVACALDQSGFVVSQITDDGYLRMRRAGAVTPHQLWDQFHEAQRVRVLTKNGYVKATTAATNGHYAQFHRADSLAATIDYLWVDIGASSRAEAERAGVALLDPVVYDRPAWWFEGFATGPNAGARAGCAAVATAAAAGAPPSGTTTFVLSTQRIFGWVGLGAFLSRLGPVDEVTVFDEGRLAASDGSVSLGGRGGRGGRGGGAQAVRSLARGSTFRGPLDAVRYVVPKVRWPGSLVESIHADDARTLLAAAATAAGVAGSGEAWASLPLDTARVLAARADAYGAYEKQFLALADLPGAPGHEWRVRDAIRAALPKWAREKATVDTAGNLVVVAGPERDPQALIAHMDEVGFEIAQIMSDGRVALRAMGGAVATAWEGRPAYLHFNAGADGRAPESLRGVFVPRDSARLRAPGTMTAWFGVDSATLIAKGGRVGLPVLAYKRGDRLTGTRVVARANDDRAGSTALLFAVQRLDPAQLKRKTWFVWSVREEGGLQGAAAFGADHGRELTRVYSIDTFVSSDTPLESPHFAYAPLGRGAVLRGLDNSTLSPPAERERILAIARAQQIPIQVGTTFGGTDGSAIMAYGPVHTSLSWPGRYSHGPAEILDLRDVDSLSRLIQALATAP